MSASDRDRGGDARRLRNGFLALTALVVGAWLVYVLTWEPAPFTLTFDDAWYYFGIARNVADGKGSTFDGINATNGYHPLWLAVSVVPFLAGLDDLAAARALLALQVVVGLGLTLVLVGGIVGRVVDGWSAVRRPTPEAERSARSWAGAAVLATLAALMANPFVVKAVVNGLESALVVPLDALLLYLVVRRGTRGTTLVAAGHRWRLGFGAVLAVTFLARTDTILLVATLGLWCLAELRMLSLRRRAGGDRPGPDADGDGDGDAPAAPGSVLGALAELFGPVAVTAAVYLVLNQRAFGTAVQISGIVKRAPLDATVLIGALVTAALAGFVGVRAFRRVHRPAGNRALRFPAAGAFASSTGWFGAFCVLVLGYYTVLQTQVWLWYFAPLVLYAVVLLLLAVADVAVSTLRGAPAGRSAARIVGPVLAVFVVPLLLLAVFEGRGFLDPSLRSIQEANRDAGRWIDENLPEDAVLASWDAGVVGYFSHRSVINLDGVVNSLEFWEAAQSGKAGRFLACRNLGYTVNHGTPTPLPPSETGDLAADVAGTEDEAVREFLGKVFLGDVDETARVVHRQPFLYSGAVAGSGGTDYRTGSRELAVFVYQLDERSMAEERMAWGCNGL